MASSLRNSHSGVTDRHEDYKIKGPGVVTGRYGTIGKVFYSDSNFWPLNTSLYVQDFKGNDIKFIYYLLQTINWNSYSTKSAVPGVDRNEVHQEQVIIPELPEQKSIASILSALDDKIELNLQMNNTLEEMAMTLYKHWFVDFEPFQEEEFKEVEFFGINRPLYIPEKFEVVNLKEILDRFKSKNKYTQKNVFPIGEIRVFDQSYSRILGFHNQDPDFSGTAKDPFLIFGDHTCRMELVCENFSVGPNLIPFKPKNSELTYIVFLSLVDKVKMNDYKRHWSELMLNQLVIPKDLDIVRKFNEHVRDNFSLIYQNEIENQNLTQFRDTLLPKLISGEVRLKNVEKTLSEVL